MTNVVYANVLFHLFLFGAQNSYGKTCFTFRRFFCLFLFLYYFLRENEQKQNT